MGVEINRLATPDAADSVAIDGTALANANGAAYHRARVEDDDDEDEDGADGMIIEESKLAHSPEPASPIELYINYNHEHTPLHSPNEATTPEEDEEEEEEEPDLELNGLDLASSTGPNGVLLSEDPLTADASTGETAGVYLGILNLYAAAPQLLGTLINFIVFAIVEPGKSRELAGGESSHAHNDTGIFGGGIGVENATESSRGTEAFGMMLLRRDHADDGPQGWNAIGVCMFIGGLSSLGAAYATWRLKHVR